MKKKKQLLLVVTIPALNEAATIASIVDGALNPIDGVDSIQVVVIDDGSTDETAKLAARAGDVGQGSTQRQNGGNY